MQMISNSPQTGMTLLARAELHSALLASRETSRKRALIST